MKPKELDAERFLAIAGRHLLVRGVMTQDPWEKERGRPEAIRTKLVVYAVGADEDGNRALMEYENTYLSPSRSYKESGEVRINVVGVWVSPTANIGEWSQTDKDLRTAVLQEIEGIIASWKIDCPPWVQNKPHLAFVKDMTSFWLEVWDWHGIAHLARMQAALSRVTIAGHNCQYYMCRHVYALGSLIDDMTANLERVIGSVVFTPPRKRV